MTFISAVTDAIANPKRVRLSQERASARSFSGLEPKMKAVRDTSPECMPGVIGVSSHYTNSTSSSRAQSAQSSRAPSRDRSAPPTALLRPTAQLQRSQSEQPMHSPRMQPQTDFPPDITTMDLNADQKLRNYSCDDLLKWDKSKFPLPPLNQMSGFGRYRRSVNADPEWIYKNMQKQIKDLQGLPLGQLDMGHMSGISDESWRAFNDPWRRRDSVISTISTATDSSASHLDPGKRLSRGFSPSASSTKSSHTSHTHVRQGSNLSTMNLPEDVDSTLPPLALKRTSTLLSERRTSGSPLTTIEEMQTVDIPASEMRRKIERPCHFTVSGDPDSAVASDAEDEDAWTDVISAVPSKVSVIAQMLKEEKKPEALPPLQCQTSLARVRTTSCDKKKANGSAIPLHRNKTIRGSKPALQRRQSKTQGPLTRAKSGPGIEIEQSEEVEPESSQSPAGLELHVRDAGKIALKRELAKDLPFKAHTQQKVDFAGNRGIGLQLLDTTKCAIMPIPSSRPDAAPLAQQMQIAYVAK